VTAPFVSFVFPVHAGGIELAVRSVLALDAQTDNDFEVVVAVDGSTETLPETLGRLMVALAELRPGVDIAIHESPRSVADLPHRNHARNVGCRAARGEYLWVLDGDIIAHPRAVEHLKALVSSSRRPLTVSPCLAQPACSPSDWIASKSPRMVEDFEVLLRSFSFKSWTTSGHFSRFTPGAPAGRHFPQLVEGQPAFPRRVWEALGGYSERYLGYGGNKVSLVRALTLLDSQEGVLSTQLMTSCVFVHQPHELDPLRSESGHRAENWDLFHAHVAEMRERAPWWRKAVEALQ
jgi:hypothetical protein